MRVDIAFADLHQPLFMCGSNLTSKLGKGQKGGVVMQYDTVLSCLIVHFKNAVALVPSATVASMEVVDPHALGIGEKSEKAEGIVSPIAQELMGLYSDNPMAGPAPTPRNPAQAEVPTQPARGRRTNQ